MLPLKPICNNLFLMLSLLPANLMLPVKKLQRFTQRRRTQTLLLILNLLLVPKVVRLVDLVVAMVLEVQLMVLPLVEKIQQAQLVRLR